MKPSSRGGNKITTLPECWGQNKIVRLVSRRSARASTLVSWCFPCWVLISLPPLCPDLPPPPAPFPKLGWGCQELPGAVWSSVSALGAAKGGSWDPQPGSRWALQVGPPAPGWGQGTRSSVLGGCDLSCPALVAVSTGGLSPKWWGWGRAAAMCRCAAAPWPGSPPPAHRCRAVGTSPGAHHRARGGSHIPGCAPSSVRGCGAAGSHLHLYPAWGG